MSEKSKRLCKMLNDYAKSMFGNCKNENLGLQLNKL